jgi:UDP-glucose 4-epimerase
MKYFVTGGAGFIGSNMVDFLAKNPENSVVIYDNFSTGIREFLEGALKLPNVKLIEGDLLDEKKLDEAMAGAEFVMHFAANADIRHGLEHPRKDLEQNTIGTFNMLEAMRKNNVKKIVFSSTGPVYGEPKVFPTPEDCPFPVQTSLYAASKLAGEGMIAAYCEGFGMTAYIFRFVSILGERYPHGFCFDFYKRLLANPNELFVYGNGKQRKSYLYIGDCISAIMTAVQKSTGKVNIYNLGTDEYIEVNQSIQWICEYMGLKPKLKYSGGERGWIGDNPFVFLDCSRIKALGWRAEYSIKDAIVKTLKYLEANKWLLAKRI